jgi:hypothetical protein
VWTALNKHGHEKEEREAQPTNPDGPLCEGMFEVDAIQGNTDRLNASDQNRQSF